MKVRETEKSVKAGSEFRVRAPGPGMRELLLGISAGTALWLDFTVVAGFLVATALVAPKLYPRAIL